MLNNIIWLHSKECIIPYFLLNLTKSGLWADWRVFSMSLWKETPFNLHTSYSAPSQLAPNSEEQNTHAEKRQTSEGNGTQRDWEKKSRGKGGSSLFRFKGNPSPLHSCPFTSCHTGLRGNGSVFVIGAIHLSIKVLPDPMGSMLWSGNPQPRGTRDEITTCLCLQ